MSERNWLTPSIIASGYFADRPDDVIDAIARDSGLSRDEMFRPSRVYDETLNGTVPVVAQRLIRWTTQKPEDVFLDGFPPQVVPDSTSPNDAFNLREYVAHGTGSIFVSTTRPYRDNKNRLRVWRRRSTDAAD